MSLKLTCTNTTDIASPSWHAHCARVTDTTYDKTVDEVRVKVFYSNGAGVETDAFDVTLEHIAVALAPTNPQTANGLLLRELSCGPKDIVSLTDGTTAVYGA